jgi:putative ABC transport system permease protein
MLKNYFKVAVRQLLKNKGYSFLNIMGLSLGMACALLIMLWVYDEYQYNKFHNNYSRLYKVLENQTYEGKVFTFAALPGRFGPAVKEEIPEVQYAARADWGSMGMFSLGDKSIYENGMFVDPDFLEMFSFNLVKGKRGQVLSDPNSLILTRTMSEKFFGKNDPIGKVLKVNNDELFTVTGLMEDPPLTSSIRFAWLAPFKKYEETNQWLQFWGNNGIQTYLQLKNGVDPARVDKKLYNFISLKDTSAIAKPFLFGIDDWRLRAKYEEGKQAGGRIELVRLFTIIAIIIIIIACINFMNLSTARSEQRAREVGVRKAMGAGRGMLIRQFFSESILLSFAAMIISGLLVWLVLSPFNTLVEKELSFSFSNPVISFGLPVMALVCGLLAGTYPSLYLSSFNPVTVFKGLRVGKNSATIYIRKGLVITQFVVSIVLIVSTIIIYRQIQHVKDRQLGYDKDNVLMTRLNGNMKRHIPTLRNELMATGTVENVAASNNRVLNVGSSSSDFRWRGKLPTSELLVSMEWTSPQYISTMGMKLKSGRHFYDDITRDSSSIIVNETFAKIMGKEDPVGEIITRDGGTTLTVVGVVKDYVFNDMYSKPSPLVLFCDTSNVNQLLVKLKPGQDPGKAVSKVEKVIKTAEPAYPFEYRFLDAEFDNLFKSEALMGRLSRIFAFLAILISCLGLFGLAAHTAERRTKEIGIRKVLGASIMNVIALLSRDFLKLVAIAAIIAFPLAWWMMHSFLNGFAYRIPMQWWVFAVAGILAGVIALFTVSFQAVKAAVTNPVKSLRTE